MSIVPYRDGRRRRAREPLDRQRIVRVALALLDEVGLDGLTMRSLAAALGVKAASLYRHVRDKQELLVLIADELSAEIPPPPAHGSWQQRARAMAGAVRRSLLSHRDAARVMAETPPMGPRRLHLVDAALAMLLDAGFGKREAARAAYHFNNFVTELVADEARMTQAARDSGASRGELMAEMGQVFRELPPGEYPALTSLAGELARDDFDGLFEFGVDVWLEGLERVHRRSRRR